MRATITTAVCVMCLGCGGGNDIGPGEELPEPRPTSETFTVDTTAAIDELSSDGVGVSVPAGGLETPSGEIPAQPVTLTLSRFLHDDAVPTDMPGSFQGRDMNGDDWALISYGVIGVEFIDANGEVLDLKDGMTGSITVPSQVTSGLATAPLWYLDETTAIWMEEGTASLVGDSYVGDVSHFSIYNVDPFCPGACISGIVENRDGTRLPGALIRATVTATNCPGNAPGIVGGATQLSDENGAFTLRWLPADSTITIDVKHGDDTKKVTLMAPDTIGSCVDAGTIVLGPAIVDPGNSHVGTWYEGPFDEPAIGGFSYRLTRINSDDTQSACFHFTNSKGLTDGFVGVGTVEGNSLVYDITRADYGPNTGMNFRWEPFSWGFQYNPAPDTLTITFADGVMRDWARAGNDPPSNVLDDCGFQ